MSQTSTISEPGPGATREEWQGHLYRLMDLMAEHPEDVEIVEAQMRAHDALRQIDYPNGYGRGERLAERRQEARYAAGLDEPGELDI